MSTTHSSTNVIKVPDLLKHSTIVPAPKVGNAAGLSFERVLNVSESVGSRVGWRALIDRRMLVALKRHQTGGNSRCEDVICPELPERADHGIKEVNDILVRLVVRSVAGNINCHRRTLEQRLRNTLTHRSASRVLAELKLDRTPSSTACRPDCTASPRVPKMHHSMSPG
jgi:hypothetical protein